MNTYRLPIQPYSSSHLNLTTSFAAGQMYISLQITGPLFHTTQIPQTLSLLEDHFPQVLTTECFNDEGLPFQEEVKATEIGHLFEHILLQHLFEAKKSLGFPNVCFSGVTSWDWATSPRGTFDISIRIPGQDLPLLVYALPKAIELTEKILASSSTRPHLLPKKTGSV